MLQKDFFPFFGIAVWNSYVVYRKNGGKNTQLEFRLNLIDRVIEKYHSGLNFHRGRPGSKPNPEIDRHFLEIIANTDKKTETCKTMRGVLLEKK
ncbi:piggyBac transposable element-derived protein 4 [Caerostris extrusa]|uniref:PiggyBac transposable element-derived protein 4 n=1 Tax=Caerostris extrusa TaxID=172846 RepID=A0AAV4TZM4_CAEEX|nr:piggyBac transposable element-derived protein 4 [Caerostris extrusa]